MLTVLENLFVLLVDSVEATILLEKAAPLTAATQPSPTIGFEIFPAQVVLISLIRTNIKLFHLRKKMVSQTICLACALLLSLHRSLY